MDFSDYKMAMRQMIDDKEFLYDSLITDIFMQGKVLGRKYKYLNKAYWVFMHGLVLSAIAYVISPFMK